MITSSTSACGVGFLVDILKNLQLFCIIFMSFATISYSAELNPGSDCQFRLQS